MNQLKARLSGAQLILFLIAVALAPLAVACSGTNPDRDYAAESSSPAGSPSDVLTPVAFDPEKLPAEFPNRCAEITDEQIAEAGLRKLDLVTSYNPIDKVDNCGFAPAEAHPDVMSVSLVQDVVPVKEVANVYAALEPKSTSTSGIFFHVNGTSENRDECAASIDTAGGRVSAVVVGTRKVPPTGELCQQAERFLNVFVKDWRLRS